MKSLSTVFTTIAGWIILLAWTIAAQSGDPAFPTPITTNEIGGVIAARDIGDPRQTTYYFLFNGNRGDVFVNIVTENFKGEIDIFTAQGLEPKTKVTIYADNPERETGRVIYQRQPEQLVLRIRGRTPNDDPATFRIKFAGSFAPITGAAAAVDNEFPDILGDRRGESNVSTTGAIIPGKKPEIETPPARPAGDDAREDVLAERPSEISVPEVEAAKEPSAVVQETKPTVVPAKPEVIITEGVKPAEEPPREVTVEMTGGKKPEVSAIVRVERVKEPDEEPSVSAEAVDPNTKREEPANPLANVFLRVEMKDGSRFERRMTEVSSVNVIEGQLTIVFSDGAVRRIDILSVKRMTIE